MTVLQVVPRLETGGVERVTLEITEAISAAGGRSLVASAGGQLEFRLARAGLVCLLGDAADGDSLRHDLSRHL